MALINQLDKYHLCYLVVNDIADDHFAGLSHVAEHTLLIPSDIGLDFLDVDIPVLTMFGYVLLVKNLRLWLKLIVKSIVEKYLPRKL